MIAAYYISRKKTIKTNDYMKKIDNKKLVTVGELLKGLKGYEKRRSDYVVNINIPDGSTLNIVSTILDEDGDLCIDVDECPDEGYYDVGMLIDELEGFPKDTRVYMMGCGLYLAFNIDPKVGHLWTDNNEDETVETDSYAFADYKYEPSGGLTEAEKREQGKKARKMSITERKEVIALVILTVSAFIGLCYNIYDLAVHSTRHAVWEHILWIVGFIIVFVVCGLTLYYNWKEKK